MIRTATITFYTILALLLITALYVHFRTAMFGDKLWEMVYARMWIDGRHLYTDIFPVSPPLIFWMYAPAAMISEYLWLGSDFQALWLMGVVIIALSLFISTRLIALHPGFTDSSNRRIQFVILFCFIFIFRTNAHYFLDREHLFIVLTFPYLLRFMPSLRRTLLPLWMRVVIGLLAGIGFCIKPHCLLVFIGVQLLFFMKERSATIVVSTENKVIYIIGITYLVLVGWLYPEYFSIVVPMALETYSASRDPAPVFSYAANAFYTLLASFMMFQWRSTSPYRQDIVYFCAVCLFTFFYALANNNWAYTYYPLSSIALFITGLVLWEFFYLKKEVIERGLSFWTLRIGIALCLLTFLFRIWISVDYFWSVMWYGCYDTIHCLREEPLMQELQGNTGRPDSFGSISMDFSIWARLSRYCGAEWQTRFPHLWMLSKFSISDAHFKDAHQWILDYVGNGYAEDMRQRKPEVMFIDNSTGFNETRHVGGLISYFSDIPAFAKEWKQYRFIHTVYPCDIPEAQPPVDKSKCQYDVYRRIPNER